MLRNYFKAAWRSLLKQKGYTLLNLMGLALGLTAVLMIGHYVQFELSYDGFHPDAEQVYRVSLEQYQNGELGYESAENYPALGPALVADLPEVDAYSRLYNMGSKNNIVVTYEPESGEPIRFKQRRLLYASEGFLPMFGYEMKRGEGASALKEPFSMVVSESYAKKYFGEENPIGKLLRLQDDDMNNELCRVTAVVEDPPANTHLKFDILISYSTLYARYSEDGSPSEDALDRYDRSWWRKDMYTYIRVVPGANEEALAAKLPGIIDKYMPELESENRAEVLKLQPLQEIHLYSSLGDEAEANGDGESVYFLLLIAGFILLIAYVNYINLATARSLERANEVGVRKVMGAMRGQLIRQFITEAAILNLAALVLAVLAYAALLPAFVSWSDLPLVDGQVWEYALWNWTWFVPALLLLWIVGSLLSGLYPAFVLSGFLPVQVLSRKFRSSKKGSLLRKGLVVFQFAACVALMIGTFTVYDQLQYVRTQDLGFDPVQMMVIERPGIMPQSEFSEIIETVKGFKTDLEQKSGISDVTSTLMIPGRKTRWKANVRRNGAAESEGHVFHMNVVDFNYTSAFGLELLAGRGFSREYGTDEDTACVITRTGARALGFENPADAIGQPVRWNGFRSGGIIVGVTEDYHQESLHQAAEAILFVPSDYAEFFLMRVNREGLAQTVGDIEGIWENRFPGNPFQYFFLDEYFDQQYRNDRRFGRIFGLFAMLAMVVGCLGLFGLSAYMAQQRFKEIGVRKVLGASTRQIWVLLTKDFLGLVLLSNVLAWPLIAYGMNGWLEGFAMRTSLNWGLFALAGLAVVCIALLTVSYQAYRVANIQPARALRTE